MASPNHHHRGQSNREHNSKATFYVDPTAPPRNATQASHAAGARVINYSRPKSVNYQMHPDLPPFRPTSAHSRPNAQYYLYPLEDPDFSVRPGTSGTNFTSYSLKTETIMSSKSSTAEMKLNGGESVETLPQAPSPALSQQETKKGWRFYAAFGSLCLVNLVCALDATSLAVALPIIAEKLEGSAIEAFWAGTSFLLTATVFQPTFTALSHVFGRREMMLIALTFFTVGAIVGGAAKDFATLLVGRSIQGTGGGGISALTYVITTDMISLRERGKWFGLITMMWAIGSVTGPIVGGAFAQGPSWRWIFWINLPFCGISYVTIPLFLRFKRTEGNMLDKFKQVDWVGSFLFIAGLTSFLIPVTWGGVMYDWTHWRTLTPLLLGVATLVLFMLWSKFLSAEPILRASMFRDPEALTAYFATTVHGMFLWSALYYMPLYFEAAKGMSPIKAGIALFPWTFTTAPAAVVVGILVTRTGRYRIFVWLGWVLATAGIALLVLYKADTPTAVWVCIGLVSGLGLGILYSSMSFAIQASASARDLPFAAALYSFFRNFGQMLGVAVGGSIFQNGVRRNLEADAELAGRAREWSRDASALVQVIKKMGPAQAGVKAKLVLAYVDSLRVVWIVMAGLAGLALLMSLAFVKGKTLDRDLETDQGFMHDTKLADEEKK